MITNILPVLMPLDIRRYPIFRTPLYTYCVLTSVVDAMKPAVLSQYFRSFLVKLNMIEAQLGQMYLGGAQHYRLVFFTSSNSFILTDDVSFAIVLELKDDQAPTATVNKVSEFVPVTTSFPLQCI